MPVAGPFRFKFDRWILPATAVRQSLALYTQGTGLGTTLRPDYDVAARVINYNLDGALPGGLAWTLVLHDADREADGFGFRSFDGLAIGAEMSMAFRTSLEPAVSAAQIKRVAPSCTDVLSTLSRAGCSRLGCHSRQTSPQCVGSAMPMAWDPAQSQCVAVPRMGLSLDDTQGLASTAVNRVAHETQTGPDVTERVVSGGRFGDQMPIIDIGRPQNSYLIYKMLIGQAFNRELGGRADPGNPFGATPMTPAQISHARDWFVQFGAMPPDEIGYPAGASPVDTYSTLRDWIRAGAICP